MKNDGLNKNLIPRNNFITIIKENDEIIRNDINELWAENILEQNFIDLKVPLKKGDHSQYLKLHTYRYCNTDKPQGIVFYLHGYTSYNNNTSYLAKSFAELNLVFVAFDVRGHGFSQGKKTSFDSIDDLLDDAKLFLSKVKQLYPGLPVFIGGISMGGLMAYKLSLESPDDFQGVFLLAPALKSKLGCCLRKFVFCLGSLCPCINLSSAASNGDVSDIISNKITAEKYIQDQVNKDSVLNISTLKALIKKMSTCEATFKNYRPSFICFMGGNDKLVDSSCGFTLIRDSPSEDKHLYFYDRMYHVVTGEDEIFDILDKIKIFMKRKLID